MESENKVLSIQSHVVHGYVGNKCSQFVLQAHGFEIDTINSVQFSNHTAYKTWKGEILSDKQLKEIYDGLKQNNINFYTHLITGYVGSLSFLSSVADILKDLRAVNKNLLYLCDPVMGDNGAFYVPETLVPVYRDVLVPLSNVVTPNQFELQVLSGITVDSEANVLKAINKLHEKGTKIIIVTSTSLAPTDDLLYGYASELKGKAAEMFRFEIKRYPAVFYGTGDLFASLLLVWLHKKRDLKSAVEAVLSCMHAVLDRTYNYAKKIAKDPKNLTVADLELRLASKREEILRPTNSVKITSVSPDVKK